MSALDIVYVVRRGEVNDELRYSLRSLVNLPHDRVWIAGYCPRWVRNVEHIRTLQLGSNTKWVNSTVNLRAACEHPDVSEQFLLFNDDMFVMQRVEQVPVAHRGPMRDLEARFATSRNSTYLRGMRATRELLEELGFVQPLSYELHIPMPVTKTGMLKALEVGKDLDGSHKRSLYGNLAEVGGELMRDPKVYTRGEFPRDVPFLSTTGEAFRGGAVGRYIRARFTWPGLYEDAR